MFLARKLTTPRISVAIVLGLLHADMRSTWCVAGWFDDELTKQKLDWKEGFDIGAQDGSLDLVGLDGANQW